LWFPAPHWRDDIIDHAKRVKKDFNATKDVACEESVSGVIHEHHRKCHLVSVNVLDMERTFKDLFNDIDVDKSKTIEFREVCDCLGFMPKPIPFHNEDGTRVRRFSSDYEPPMPSPLTRQLTAVKEQSAKKVRTLLRQHSILQEAILKLVEKLIYKEESFQVLYRNNAREALKYLENVIAGTRRALDDIENGVEHQPKKSWCCQSTDGEWKRGKATGVSEAGWKEISAEIFRDLFF
jgi:hypothetical protein